MNDQDANRSMFSCSLTTPDEVAKRRFTIGKLRSAVQEVRPLNDGYALRFPADEAWCETLAAFIAFERRCCPFLAFTLTFEPYGGSIWLSIHGPGGVQKFIQREVAAAREGEQ